MTKGDKVVLIHRIRKTLSLSHKNGPTCFLNSFLERSLVQLDPDLVQDLVNGLCLSIEVWGIRVRNTETVIILDGHMNW